MESRDLVSSVGAAESARQRLAARRRLQKGQATLELIFTMPIIFILLFGLIEFGNGLNAYLTLVASARDGARLGGQGSATENEIRNMIAKEIEPLMGTLDVYASCDPGPGVCITPTTVSSGDEALRVKVCYFHSLLVGIDPFSPFMMCSSTTMRVIE